MRVMQLRGWLTEALGGMSWDISKMREICWRSKWTATTQRFDANFSWVPVIDKCFKENTHRTILEIEMN